MSVVFQATINTAPRTKKNHGRIVMRGKHPRLLPSEAFEVFEKKATLLLSHRRGLLKPIDYPVNARVVFYRDALRGDAVGYYQAIADVLEKAGIVSDDKWIVSWDGSTLAKDASNPRLEIELEAIGDRCND